MSGHRKRFQSDKYDLDLSYITPKVISMGAPSSGFEKTYRNDINEVARMLDDYHRGHYMIFNVSERKYDVAKFHFRVQTYSFPDHNAPPLFLLYRICTEIHRWLQADERHVVAIHCKAGKVCSGILFCLCA